MQRHRRFFLGLALSALVGLIGNSAQAGSISLSVDLNGVVIYTATSSAPDQSVSAVLTAVDTALASHGSAYRFTSLSAQSNYTGSSYGSLQTTFQLNTSGAGTTAAVLSIDTTQFGFLSPVGAGGTAVSTAGGSYNTATGSLSYTSDFQGASTPTLVFPVSGTASYSNTTGAIHIGSVPSGYELSNHFLISLTKGPSTFLGGTGGIVVSVPEPSSIVTMLIGMPLPIAFVFGVIRRRRLAGA
ncbi:MAG: PEP-CTERM sorting domain-containing protein [Isosphaeraceae bacterium]